MKEFMIALFSLIILFLIYFLVTNRRIQVRHHTFDCTDDLRIVHLSDVHNTSFGENDCHLLDKVKQAKPDVILISGDLLNKRNPDENDSYRLIDDLLKIAPVYFVRGNHEHYTYGHAAKFLEGLKQHGVTVLCNEKLMLKNNIQLIGLDDINFYSPTDKIKQREGTKQAMDRLVTNAPYNILLTHQPQLFDVYQQYDVDLILSGHTHGGIIRIPFVGGIFAPGQGVMPKYDSGLFEENNTKLIISRGLGKAVIPLRMFCQPEVIIIDLKKNCS